MMKLGKRLYTYMAIATLVLATGCASSKVKVSSSIETGTQQQADEQINQDTDAEYKDHLFDTSYVHNINIEISEEDWKDLLENPKEQNFYSCNITIDGEEYSNVGIRTKGNSSLSQVANSDSDRYSFKINFKKYEKGQNYYGLEKLNLNNIIQDTTYMKDYLAYTMMGQFGVASPYVSYSYITVNGEEWGLYLNVEDIDESFLERYYGDDYGNLYKPETMDMNGDNKLELPEGFDPEKMMQPAQNDAEAVQPSEIPSPESGHQNTRNNNNQVLDKEMMKGGPGSQNSLGADLKYTDDNYESYANIFDYADTDITDEDKDTLIASLKQLSEGKDLDEVLDIDALLRYFVVHNFVDNYDSYTGNMLHNYYLYEEDGKLTMLPWDYNLSFGAFGDVGSRGNKGNRNQPDMKQEAVSKENEITDTGATSDKAVEQAVGSESDHATVMVNMAIDTPLSDAEEADRPMWSQLINNDTYKVQYHELFSEFLESNIENKAVESEIDRIAELISPYVKKDPTAFYTYEEFTKGVETLKTFIELRGESIRKQLTGEIPSTTEEQESCPDKLVDASSINISDMGSNDMGKTPGEQDGRGFRELNNNEVLSNNK